MKIKKLIPVLCALVVLFTMVVPVAAADDNIVEVKGGSQSAKVTFTVEDVLAFDGTVSTSKNSGFKVAGMEVTGAIDGSIVKYSEEGDQVVVIGKTAEPTTLKIAVTLESSSPMRDGKYPVSLSYGLTNHNGSYSANRRESATVYVGIKASDEAKEDKGSSTTQTATESTVEDAEEPETTVVLGEGELPDRVSVIGLLDVSRLRTALKNAAILMENGDLNTQEKNMLQNAIDQGNEALQGDLQYKVDEATERLNAVIDELGGPIEEPQLEEEDSNDKGSPILIIILAVVAVLAILAALYLGYRYKKKNKNQSYDGAPIVDYHIGDDDV